MAWHPPVPEKPTAPHSRCEMRRRGKPLCGAPGTDCETGAEDQDNRIFLFIRKDENDNEAKEFYFLGEIYAEGEPQPIQMAQSKRDAFEINYRLDRPVRDDIYEYIVEETV